MSKHDYEVSIAIAMQDHSFYALIMAAMRQADTENITRLRAAFPDTWYELRARYNAPGGMLSTDQHTFSASYSDARVCIVCHNESVNCSHYGKTD